MATPQYISLKNDYVIIEEIGTKDMGTTSLFNINIEQGYVRQVPSGVTMVAAGDWVAFEPPLKSLKIIQGNIPFYIVHATCIIYSYTEPISLP